MADDNSLLDLLPPTYAVLLRLRASGADDSVIAGALGVPVQSVATLAVVAESKLARLRDDASTLGRDGNAYVATRDDEPDTPYGPS
jgi:hypothetical protein